jgi:hypothetical protein
MRKSFEGISRICLRGRRYRILLATKLGSDNAPLDGDCSNPIYPDRIIRYYVGLRGENRLNVLIHEMLHACFWDVREEGIEEASTDASRVLWRVGYRNDDDLLLPDRAWPHTVLLRRKRWAFERVAGLPTGSIGMVSKPLDKPKKISVRISLNGERELEAVLRLTLLACYPDFDEEAIGETSKDIARALWRIGYRRTIT